MSILLFFIILLVLVLIHEFGHFIAAKKNGVRVEEFGFGFPPRLIGKKIGETIYSFNLLPIGGFVKLYGEEYVEVKKEKQALKDKDKTFVYKKPGQKAIIIVAGVVMNFLLGWVLISYLFTQGVPTPTNKVIIEHVVTGSPAAESGLKTRDVVTKLIYKDKEYNITSSSELISLTKKFAGEEMILVLERDSSTVEVRLTPRKNPPVGQGPLGVAVTSFVEKKYPWYQAPFFGLVEAFNITKHIVVELSKTFIQLITFQKPQVDVAGPIGIARFTGEAMKFGQNAVLQLVALLSLNLAVVNILPFPALDGGRLVFVIYEWITRKRVNHIIERNLNLIGIILLLTLALAITINDIMKIYR